MTAEPVSRSVQFGLGFQADERPGDYARLALLAERYGFDVLSVFGDLMYQPPIVPLLEMARATSRVRLGAACWNPYSMYPYEIAGQVAALDLASAGRAYVGLARGSWLGDVGLLQPRPLAYLGEAAEVIYRLLADNPEGFTGTIFRLAPGTTLRYRTQRPDPPLLIGTWGPQTARLAGRIANEVKIGGTANPAMVDLMRQWITAGTAASGRAADDVAIVVGAVTVVDSNARVARRRAREEAALYLPVVADLDPTIEIPTDLLTRIKTAAAEGDRVAAATLIPDDLLDLFAFAGTPEDVAARTQALIDAGADRVEFGTPHGITDDGGVELLGSAVLPMLRR